MIYRTQKDFKCELIWSFRHIARQNRKINMNAPIRIQKLILIRMNIGAQKTLAQKVKGVFCKSPSNTYCNDLNMSPSSMFVVLHYFTLLVCFWKETENAFKGVEHHFDLFLIFSRTLVQNKQYESNARFYWRCHN